MTTTGAVAVPRSVRSGLLASTAGVAWSAVGLGTPFGVVVAPGVVVLAALVHGLLALVGGRVREPGGSRSAPRAVHRVVAVLPCVVLHGSMSVVAAVAAAWIAGGGPGDLLDGLQGGLAPLFAARWPVAPTPAAVSVLALVASLAGAAAVVAVRIGAPPVVAVVPSLGLVVTAAVTGAPAGPPPSWHVAGVVGSSVVTMATVAGARANHVRSGRRRWRVAGPFVIAVAVAVAVTGVVGEGSRLDPRVAADASASATVEVSPLARVDEWRSITPPALLFRVSGDPVPRWRLVALDRFDGRSWMPPDDLRPAGADRAGAADDLRVEVTVGALDGRWVPVPDGELLGTSRPVRVDANGGALLADEPLTPGEVVTVRSQPAGRGSSARDEPTVRAGGEVDGFEVPAALVALAGRIVAGATDDYERAVRLAAYLRGEFRRDESSPPGHSIAVLETFLERSRRGRSEQFVASFGVLALSVGLPVRIAVGFVGNDGTVRSDTAFAWPEVHVDGTGWVALDPVPEVEQPAAGDDIGDAPALLEPATAPPAPATTAPSPPTTLAGPQLPVPVVAGGFPSGVAVIPGVALATATLAAAAVVGRKRVRSRARRTAGSPDRVVLGAFAEAMDRVHDLGGERRASATDAELVEVAVSRVGAPVPGLGELAVLATAAAHAPEPATETEAARALVALGEVERELGALPRRHRWRARCSLRSLRRPFPW